MKLLLILCTLTFAAQWGEKPQKWGDFQMGLNNNYRQTWTVPMLAALDAGIQLDRRYVYANLPEEVGPTSKYNSAFIFADWRNYAKDPAYFKKGIRPTITIYMLQHGEDGKDAVKTWCGNKGYMKEYFEAIVTMADSSKGTEPIYVIEPDVWGYLIQNAESDLGAANLNIECHINDLGLDWLEEFDNKVNDLPAAVIKTLKMRDPDSYAGVLMAYWGYRPTSANGNIMVKFSEDAINDAAVKTAEFAKKLLRHDKYRGDFIGVEKNGADGGWYVKIKGISDYMWNDTENAKWVLWSKTMAKTLNMPLLGWQICIGHEGLPNTSNRYEDTFFPYFYNHVPDFVDAGFIGLMAGCGNQDVGTQASMKDNEGDNGWFYNKLKTFNQSRPYLDHLKESSTTSTNEEEKEEETSLHQIATTLSYTPQGIHLNNPEPGIYNLYNMQGKIVLSIPSMTTRLFIPITKNQKGALVSPSGIISSIH